MSQSNANSNSKNAIKAIYKECWNALADAGYTKQKGDRLSAPNDSNVCVLSCRGPWNGVAVSPQGSFYPPLDRQNHSTTTIDVNNMPPGVVVREVIPGLIVTMFLDPITGKVTFVAGSHIVVPDRGCLWGSKTLIWDAIIAIFGDFSGISLEKGEYSRFTLSGEQMNHIFNAQFSETLVPVYHSGKNQDCFVQPRVLTAEEADACIEQVRAVDLVDMGNQIFYRLFSVEGLALSQEVSSPNPWDYIAECAKDYFNASGNLEDFKKDFALQLTKLFPTKGVQAENDLNEFVFILENLKQKIDSNLNAFTKYEGLLQTIDENQEYIIQVVLSFPPAVMYTLRNL